jgi:uncharacterized protein (DUF2461 family)
MWAPQPPQLHRVREHISNTYPEIQRISRTRTFRRDLGDLQGDRLSRVPRGFKKDDPAAEYLKYYRFVAGREFPASLATSAEFYPTLLRTFRALMPLVRFLNEPLL